MSKIQAIYWDVGGVLVRTFSREPRTALAQRFGTTYEALEQLVWGGERGTQAQLGQVSAQAQWEWACAQLGRPASEASAIREQFFSGDGLDMALIAVIRQQHQHYRTGVISNAMDDTRRLFDEPWGIRDAFDLLVFSAEVGIMKPDARIFQLALKGLDVPAEAAVFIDDFTHNVEGARAVGMRAIHFRSPAQALAELDVLLNQP